MENGVLLTLPQRPIIFLPQPQLLQLRTSHFQFTSQHQHQHLHFSFTVTNYTKWDSNGERLRAQNFKFSFNPKDDEEEDDDDDVEEEEEEEESFYGNVKKNKKRRWWSKKPPKVKNNMSGNVFDRVIESVWILKVFKSFGWFLPAIIISYLLATGPKAFLTTLGLSLALSLLLLAFEKLWGKKQYKPKRKVRMRRKASSIYTSVEMEEGQAEEFQEIRKVKTDNKSQVGSSNGPVKRGSQGVPPDFGGWDFVDEPRSMQGTSRVTNESKKRTRNGKLSGSGRKSDTPLLLRLLIAVFPFIGFLTKLFW